MKNIVEDYIVRIENNRLSLYFIFFHFPFISFYFLLFFEE